MITTGIFTKAICDLLLHTAETNEDVRIRTDAAETICDALIELTRTEMMRQRYADLALAAANFIDPHNSGYAAVIRDTLRDNGYDVYTDEEN